jgi:hypothetical protein
MLLPKYLMPNNEKQRPRLKSRYLAPSTGQDDLDRVALTVNTEVSDNRMINGDWGPDNC